MSSSSTKLSFPGTFREAKMISKFTSFHFGTCCRFQLILGVFLRHTRSFLLYSGVIAIYTHQHSSVIAFPLSLQCHREPYSSTLQCHSERPSYASLRVLTFIVSTTQSFFPVMRHCDEFLFRWLFRCDHATRFGQIAPL